MKEGLFGIVFMPLDGGPRGGRCYSVGQRLLSPASFSKAQEITKGRRRNGTSSIGEY